MVKKDCFALKDNGRCSALTQIDCENCAFYKTKEAHKKQVMELELKRRTFYYADMVKMVKESCPVWTDFRDIEERNRVLDIDSIDIENMGDIFRDLRKNMGLTQSEIAVKIGCSKQRIQEIERSKRLSHKTQMRICERLGLADSFFVRRKAVDND